MVPSVRVFMALRCEREWVGAERERGVGVRQRQDKSGCGHLFAWSEDLDRSPWNEVTEALDFVHKPILEGAVGVRDGDTRHRRVVDFC